MNHYQSLNGWDAWSKDNDTIPQRKLEQNDSHAMDMVFSLWCLFASGYSVIVAVLTGSYSCKRSISS